MDPRLLAEACGIFSAADSEALVMTHVNTIFVHGNRGQKKPKLSPENMIASWVEKLKELGWEWDTDCINGWSRYV